MLCVLRRWKLFKREVYIVATEKEDRKLVGRDVSRWEAGRQKFEKMRSWKTDT